MTVTQLRVGSALLMLSFLSGCGFGVGSFRERNRSGLFRSDNQEGVATGYERVHRESWTDTGGTLGTFIGFKPAVIFGPHPQTGVLGVGYGFEAHLNFRWRMLELTGGFASEAIDFEADKSRFAHGSGVVGLNYYFLGSEYFFPYLGASFQMGTVRFIRPNTRDVSTDDVIGGRGTVGLAVVLPGVIWENDLMLRLEGRFIGTLPARVPPEGPSAMATSASFLGGAVSFESVLFF